MEVKGKELVTIQYGGWPSFHDAEILSIELTRGSEPGQYANLISIIYLYQRKTINEGTAQYETLSSNENVITIEFQNIDELNIGGFNHQNVIEELHFKEKGGSIYVEFESIFGVHCSFSCKEIVILSVVPKGS